MANKDIIRLRNTLLQVADSLTSLKNKVPQEAAISAIQATPGPSGALNTTSSSGSKKYVQGIAANEPVTHQVNSLDLSVSTAAQEHRRLFNYKSSGGSTKKKGKRPQTCTLKFVCLAKQDSVKPPTSIKERTQLCSAGLGEHSIQFELQQGTLECHQRIIQTFPKLEKVGYELLLYQRGEDCGFYNLPMPYTPRRLKDAAGNSKIYIKPLQKDLEVDVNPEELDGELKVAEGPLIKCLKCGVCVLMGEMKNHQETVHDSPQTKKYRKSSLETWIDLQDCEDANSDSEDGCSLVLGHEHNAPVFVPGQSTDLTACEKVDQLMEMFPDSSRDLLSSSLAQYGSVAKAALSLVETSGTHNDDHSDSDADLMEPVFLQAKVGDKPKKRSLSSLLEELKGNMSSERVKLKVDEEDLLNDAMAYYKDPDFDPKKILRVMYNNQPAADTGGVTRQFFTRLLYLMSDEFFHGENYKSPVYSSVIVASGLMKLVGMVIVHSILQGGPGLPLFSPAVYHYLSTGDVDGAIQKMCIKDCSLRIQNFINMVAEAVDVGDVNQDEVTDVLSECGLTVSLTNENKLNVIQAVIIHDVIGKPKIVLDQLREGLEILNFGVRMKEYPQLFEKLFVPPSTDLSGTDVLNVLHFPTLMNGDEMEIRGFLENFLKNSDAKTLKNFLVFTTGATCLPKFGLGKIRVEYEETSSIFASTCLQSITFPKNFDDEANFSTALMAVIDTDCKSFNCI